MLLEFSNNWKKYFEKEKELLLSALKGQAVNEVRHIGATAVVLCKTAGTIDLMCAIPSSVEFYTIKNLLVNKGYTFVGTINTLDGMYFIRKNKDKKVVSTIRLVEYASRKYQELLLFMHFLREKREHVEFYNTYRREVLENYKGDRVAYEKLKHNYIASVLLDHCEIKEPCVD